jgi:glycosyltransferase involved in cell wall biosynthesis
VRVALVGPYPLDPARAQGGVETSFVALVAALSGLADVEPSVVSFVAGLDRARRAEVDGVSVEYLPRIRRLGALTLHLRERRALGRSLGTLKPDLVHAHDATRYGYVCLTAAEQEPVVIVIHGISRQEQRFERSPIGRARFLLAGSLLERYCIRHARYVLQPTPYAAALFGRELRGRTWEVPNPVADGFFGLERDPVPGRILYAGTIIPLKRVLDLVEALGTVSAALPEAHLRVAGGGLGSPYGRRVQARVRELELDSRVTFLGALSSRELVDEYRRASVLVLPSAQENSPVVIAEAMAVGVPVVATRVGGVSYLVDEGRTGFIVEAGDVSALAERIVEVLADPTGASLLGANARERAERFRARAVAERVREVYAEVLRLHAVGAGPRDLP